MSSADHVSSECEWCGEWFSRPRPQGEGQRFCSRSCAAKHQHSTKEVSRTTPEISTSLRKSILDRDQYQCQRCGTHVGRRDDNSVEPAEIHHVVPKRAGGSNHRYNLVTLCSECHNQIHWVMKRLPETHPKLLEELRDVVCEGRDHDG